MNATIKINGQIMDHQIPTEILTYPNRLKRSIKAIFIFVTAASFSIFIPVLHFVLVPTLLFLAFFLSYSKFQEKYKIDLEKVHCPSCQAKLLEKDVFVKSNRPTKLYCFSCRKQIDFSI
ncbi:MAG: hypothetical protein K1X29_03215 [Bdellovibrionales bacterium]|nr:hypothetical protein [Bdellovibrionales bacterium]